MSNVISLLFAIDKIQNRSMKFDMLMMFIKLGATYKYIDKDIYYN